MEIEEQQNKWIEIEKCENDLFGFEFRMEKGIFSYFRVSQQHNVIYGDVPLMGWW